MPNAALVSARNYWFSRLCDEEMGVHAHRMASSFVLSGKCVEDRWSSLSTTTKESSASHATERASVGTTTEEAGASNATGRASASTSTKDTNTRPSLVVIGQDLRDWSI